MNCPFKGKTRPAEVGRKISASKRGVTTRSGYTLSEATKEKIRRARALQSPPVPAGFVYPFRKVTSRLQAIRMSKRYRDWRTAVFTHDNYTCQECGNRGGQLNADHIKSFARYPKYRFDLANGRTLCEACHRMTPTFGGRSKRGLKLITSIEK